MRKPLRLSSSRFNEIFQLYHMQNGTADQALRNAVLIAVHANIQRVLLNYGHIMMRDIVCRAIAEVNTKWFERFSRNQFA